MGGPPFIEPRIVAVELISLKVNVRRLFKQMLVWIIISSKWANSKNALVKYSLMGPSVRYTYYN